MTHEQDELLTAEVTHHKTMGEALIRLRKNKDFQAVIEEGFLKDKVLASVSLLAVPQRQEQGGRVAIMEDIVAASNLQFYFSMIENFYEGITNPVLSDAEEDALEEFETVGGAN